MHRQTREWKDGLFSSIMRDLANMTSDCKNFLLLLNKINEVF
jgi:hypothetical protein